MYVIEGRQPLSLRIAFCTPWDHSVLIDEDKIFLKNETERHKQLLLNVILTYGDTTIIKNVNSVSKS